MYRHKHWPQFLATLSVVLSTFSSGIYMGWTSPSLPKLLSGHHPLNMTIEESYLIVTIDVIGTITGNVVFTKVADGTGRKTSLLSAAPFHALSMVLISFLSYSNVYLLYLARFLGGMAQGASATIVPIYIGEISEPKVRGFLLSIFTVSWYFGSLFINILGSYCTIETASSISLIGPLIFIMTFLFMPESPYYLLMKNKIEESRSALKKLRLSEDVEEELEQLTTDVRRQMSEKGRYLDLLLIKSNRNAAVIVFSVILMCELSGDTSLMFYSQLFFKEATDVIPENWAAILMVLLQLVFTLVSCFLLDYVGRRCLLLSSIAGCFLSLACLSVFFFLRDYSSLTVSHFNWIPLVGMIFLEIFFNIGLGNIVCCFYGELFSASIKTKGVCVVSMFYSLCVFVVVNLYQILHGRYGLTVPLLMFALSELVGWIFCWRFVPETKGKSLEEIQQEMKGLLSI